MATEVFRFLNGRYRTRYAAAEAPAVVEVILAEVADRGWWSGSAPPLFESGPDTVSEIAALVPLILRRLPKRAGRPFSLTTKFLHFCLPETFPIFDSQAAASIQAWSYDEFSERGKGWQLFSTRSMCDPAGQGYAGVVAFYHRFWSAASAQEREQLSAGARGLEGTLRTISSTANARVTVLDMLDKTVWRANGDPLYLGLR
jgi:hypothetical protein